MLHKRSDKSSHLDTVLYEIDMLRHCSKTLMEKKARASVAEEEYYLGIEGFLLHLRNLLAFFTTDHVFNDDLSLDKPTVWAGKAIHKGQYGDLIAAAKKFNDQHGEKWGTKKIDCYKLISKFLQHCTPERYELAMSWDIDKMSAQIEPILADFEKRFAPAVTRTAPRERVSVESSYSTSPVRTSVVSLGPAEKQ